MKFKSLAVAASALMILSGGAVAYDGTKCSAPGDCWDAKPGFPEKIKGTKYDPKHSEKELNKQTQAMQAMEKRNAERVEQFKKTGNWVY